MKIKFNDSNGIIKKILAITVSLVMVFNILPFFAEFNASALGEVFYDSSLGNYYEENGVLTALPNENCGFRGWFNTFGEEVSLSKSFVLPQGKTKNDFYPVFYDFNILENGDFEEYTVGTDLKEKWHSTNSSDTFIVCENIAKSGENSLAMVLNNSTAYSVLSGLEENTQYTVSFYYKGESSLNTVMVIPDSAEVKSGADLYGEKYLAHKNSAELAEGFSASDWNKVGLTFFTAEHSSVKICLYSADNKTAYVDKISLVKDSMAAPNYFNDGFDYANGATNQNFNIKGSKATATVVNNRTAKTVKMVCNASVSYVTGITVKANNNYRITFDYYAPTLGTIGNSYTAITSVGVAPKSNGQLVFRNHTTVNPAAIMTVHAVYSWAGAYDANDRVNNSYVKASVSANNKNNWYRISFEFSAGNNSELQFYVNPATIGSGTGAYLEISNFKLENTTTGFVQTDLLNKASDWTALNSAGNVVGWAAATEGNIADENGYLKVTPLESSSVINSNPIYFKKGATYTVSANIDISEILYSLVPKLDDNKNIALDDQGNVIFEKIYGTNTNMVNWINFSLSNVFGDFGTSADNSLVVSNGNVAFKVTDSADNSLIARSGSYSAFGFGLDSFKRSINPSDITVSMTFTPEETGVGYFNIRMNGYETYYINSISLVEDSEDTDVVDILKNSSLKTVGTAIRTEGKQGIRHKTSLDKALLTADNSYGLRFIEYGTLAIKTEYLGGNELVSDGNYSFNGNEYTAKKGVAYSFNDKTDKVFSNKKTTIDYTAVLINIAKGNWNSDYTVRAYFKYLDSNGNEGVIYINPFDVAVYPVAKAAYSAKKEGGEYKESADVRNYLYKNILTGFTDKKVTVANASEPIYNNFQGISSTVYHATAFFPDSHGRTYTDAQAAIEMDRLKSSKVTNVRTRFDSHWMWTASGWDWDSVKMNAVYKWANMLSDRDISITLNLGWSIRDFIYYYDYNKNNNANNYSTNGHSSITEVDYLHGVGEDIYGEDSKISTIKNYPNINLTNAEKAHYSVVAARYAEWGKQALNAFKARGINNIEYVIPFTETGYSMEATGDNTFSYDEWLMFTMALHDALKEEGIRNNYKIIGPCQSIQAQQNRKIPFIEYIYSNISGTDYENMLDINAMHQYTQPDTKAGYKNTVYDPVASYSFANKNFSYYKQVLNNAGVSNMEFWCDEYFAYANDAKWQDNVGMQMTQFAAGLTAGINNGVNRFLSWQMFDVLWDANVTHGTAHTEEGRLINEFIGGVHAVGTCPSLVKANGETCTRANCPCKNYTAYSSYTPRVTYYGINLLGRFLNNKSARVYSTIVTRCDDEADGGLYVSAIENDNGEVIVLVVNTMPTTSSVNVSFENKNVTSLKRYVYDPNEIIPTAEATPIESDKTISLGGSFEFYDVIPAGSFAIYQQSGFSVGDDFDMDMGEE